MNVCASGSWYRFDAQTGGKMAEGCVDFLHCGTIYPASLKTNGSHPTSKYLIITAFSKKLRFYSFKMGCYD